MERFFAPLEVKFAGNEPEGIFSGYASFFGNVDAHGDRVERNAFTESLAERKAAGRAVPMYVQHRLFGDGIPKGVWRDIVEDDKGLRVEGKISGMNTDAGRLLYELVKDGALGGLSIGYKVRPNGAIFGKGNSEPRRTLVAVDLREISLVDEPSNALTRIDEVKAAMPGLRYAMDAGGAANALEEAMRLHAECMAGGDTMDAAERAQMMTLLQDAYEALTGNRMPLGMKMMPGTIRECEALLRASFGLSHSQARAFAERGFKSLSSTPREEGGADPAISQEVKAALDDLKGLAGFRLPNLRG